MKTQSGQGRRARRRFEIEMDLQCKLPDGEVLKGTTEDISSRAIRFRADRKLPVGQDVKLSVMWPVRLNDRWPLQLIVRGRVIRDDERGIVVVADCHEFRLLQSPAPKAADRAGSMHLLGNALPPAIRDMRASVA